MKAMLNIYKEDEEVQCLQFKGCKAWRQLFISLHTIYGDVDCIHPCGKNGCKLMVRNSLLNGYLYIYTFILEPNDDLNSFDEFRYWRTR